MCTLTNAYISLMQQSDQKIRSEIPIADTLSIRHKHGTDQGSEFNKNAPTKSYNKTLIFA